MDEEQELDEIKRRKMQELMQTQQMQENQEEEKKQLDAQKAMILRKILTSEARERLTRVKLARPQVGETVENQLIYLAQIGKIGKKIDDNELKMMLQKLTAKKHEMKIERR